MSLFIFDCHDKSLENPAQIFTRWLNTGTKTNDLSLEDEICGEVYHRNSITEDIDVIMRIVRKNWCYLQNVVLTETTLPASDLLQIRQIINKCMTMIMSSLNTDCKLLRQRILETLHIRIKNLSNLLLPPSELEKNIILKLTSSSANKEKCPIHHYFHIFQDFQFYYLLFYSLSGKNLDLKDHVHFCIKHLVLLSEDAYKNNIGSAFICDCNRNLWFIIYLCCERQSENMFWEIFNEVVESFNKEFVLWLLKDTASLQAHERINPNFCLIENALRAITTNTKQQNTSLLPSLKSVEFIVCNLWMKWSKIEIYQILWEYFSKRLNLIKRNIANGSVNDLVELLNTILWAPKDCKTDFDLFLSMLSSHLSEHPHQWGKMKGRIYSQLSPNKLKDLNDDGISNVMILFLSLTKVSFDELSQKFLFFVQNLSSEKKQTLIIWNFYITFLIFHLRENRNIEASSSLFIKLLEEASTNQKQFYLITSFVKNLDIILSCNANFQLHQSLLINSWIYKYMGSCCYGDLSILLDVLLKIINLVNAQQVWSDWELAFKNYVYSSLKCSRNLPEASGTIAAKIAVLCPSLSTDAFTFFNSETIAPKVAANFLCVALEDYPNSFVTTTHQESIALQTWVKCCLFSRDYHKELTTKIARLNIIPAFLKSALTSAEDPLYSFIESLGRDTKQQEVVSRLCDVVFGQVDRWISKYFTHPENEIIVLRIYTTLGLAFFKIGFLLYDKHKSNCPFARIVSTILLPTELMIGKSLNTFILQSIKKTWHIFFGAIVKLYSPSDAFLDRILREMVVRYVPHFSTLDTPLMKCLDNNATAEVILDKLSYAFFKQPIREAESNIVKALKIVGNFVQSTTSIELLGLVVKHTLYGIFETIMFHNQRNIALSIVGNITTSSLFPNVRNNVEEVLMQITEKHLAFNTPNYFQLLEHLTKLIPEILKSMMPIIKKHISNVERMRGIGYDKTLRLSIQRLEASLLNLS